MSEALIAAAPYKGLIPYYEEDARFFFGRESEQEIIAANLMAWRLTLLFGPSGVGKSSVLRAGVASRLQRLSRGGPKRTQPDHALVVFNEWRDDPLGHLAAQIQASTAGALGIQARGPEKMPEHFADLLQTCTERLGGHLLIILDQFEEYFLYHPQTQGRNAFDSQFPDAVNNLDLPVHFLVSIREDALAKLDRFEGHISNLFDNYLRVEYLDLDAARDAITKPIDRYNKLLAPGAPPISIEPPLVDAILDEVRTGRLALGEAGRGAIKRHDDERRIETPFLQLVMMRLWQAEVGRGSRVLRLETLKQLGGAERIVSTHLDSAMAALKSEEKDTAARIFHYLVTPSGTKIAHTVTDLSYFASLSEKPVSEITKKLASQTIRILRTVAAPIEHPGAQRYEIFHDVLAIPILDWRRRHLAQSQVGRELLRLKEADAYNASVQKWRIVIFVAVGVAVLVAWFLYSRHDANASLARELAQRAASLPPNELELGVLLAMESQQRSGPNTVDTVLQQGLSLLAQPLACLKANEIISTSIAISPDGSLLVTSATPNYPYLYFWNFAAQAGSTKRTIDKTRVVEFRPDGNQFVRLSTRGRAEVWSVVTGTIDHVIINGANYSGEAMALAVSPGGGRLAVIGSGDEKAIKGMSQAVRVYDITANPASEIARIPMTADLIEYNPDLRMNVMFSSDGEYLALALDNQTIEVWSIKGGPGKIGTFQYEGYLVSFILSQDGRRLGIASQLNAIDSSVEVWEPGTHTKLLGLRYPSQVNAISISPQSTLLAVGLGDSTARVLNIDTNKELATFRHNLYVNSVSFSPDENYLATGSSDHTGRVWDISKPHEVARMMDHAEQNTDSVGVKSVRFSPDGKYVTTAFGGSATDCNYVRSWLWKPEDRASDLCSRLTGPLDEQERKLYLRNEDQKSCPNGLKPCK